MEQTAAPGTIQLTEHTYKLVAGYFDCDDLGLVSVKGLAEKVRAYRVTGERGGRARIDVARERGFTRLVGRERELDLLRQCFALAQERTRAGSVDHWRRGAGEIAPAVRVSPDPRQPTTVPGSTAAVIPTARPWPMGPSSSCSSSTSRLTSATGTRTSGAKSTTGLQQLGPALAASRALSVPPAGAWTAARAAGGAVARGRQAPDL